MPKQKKKHRLVVDIPIELHNRVLAKLGKTFGDKSKLVRRLLEQWERSDKKEGKGKIGPE